MFKKLGSLILPLFISNQITASSNLFQVELELKNAKQRSEAANYLHLDKVEGTKAFSVVNEYDLAQALKHLKPFIKKHGPFTKVPAESTLSDEYEYPTGDEAFHTYDEVMDSLKESVLNYPHIASLIELGHTVEGKSITGIRISQTQEQKDSEIPAIFMVGSHHAREHLSTEIPMLMIKHLLSNYGKSEEITQLINTREILIVPMLNSDGAMYDIKGRKYKMWRKNRFDNSDGSYGVDLNRNYSFGWGTGGSSRSTRSDVYMGPKPFSEPETIAVKEFVESRKNIKILLSFHTFSELILYPWGGKNSGIGGKDQQVFEIMARKMATWNNYKPMQASGLYIASGDTCDWAYGEHGIFCFTFELSPKSQWSGGFYPGAKVIQKVFQDNIKPVLYLIDKSKAPYSVL